MVDEELIYKFIRELASNRQVTLYSATTLLTGLTPEGKTIVYNTIDWEISADKLSIKFLKNSYESQYKIILRPDRLYRIAHGLYGSCNLMDNFRMFKIGK